MEEEMFIKICYLEKIIKIRYQVMR